MDNYCDKSNPIISIKQNLINIIRNNTRHVWTTPKYRNLSKRVIHHQTHSFPAV